MAVAKNNHNLIFLAGQKRVGSKFVLALHKSTDGGNNWKSFTVNPQAGSGYSLAVDPKNPGIVYIGGFVGDRKGAIFKSTNGGQAWKEIGKSTFGKRYDYVRQIVVDPNDSSRLYVITERGIYMSNNFGSSWNSISSDYFGSYSNIDYILIDTKNSQKLFTTGYDGVFFSPDRGGSWSQLDNKLTVPNGLCLALNQAKSYLFVGTDGGGIYRSVVKKLK